MKPLRKPIDEQEMTDMTGIINDNAQLTTICAEAGTRHGYEDIQAEFSPFRDFKVKWTRSYKWISFEFSDYLRGAPEDVVRSLADTIFAKLRGEGTEGYGPTVTGYITSPEFVREHQPVYVRRMRGFGPAEWVDEAVDALRGQGFEIPEHTLFGELGTGLRSDIGRSSVLMRVVAMSTRCADLPENARNYAVLKQMAVVAAGFTTDSGIRRSRVDAILERYPGRLEAERELRAAGLN